MNLTKRVPIRSSQDWSVWRGEQSGSRRLYLVKEAVTDSPYAAQLAARLRDECRFLTPLDHPHLVKPVWADASGLRAAFSDVQCNLAEYIAAHGRLTPTLVANVMAMAAEALEYLHARRLGHGCVNANTLLVGPSGDVKFGDFLGYEFGTNAPLPVPDPDPRYQAPELIDGGLGRPGPGSDLYCLGYLALELLTGPAFERLFGLPDAANWLAWHADPYKQLADWQPVVAHAPAGLVEVIAGLIPKRPEERAFPSAAQLKAALVRSGLTSEQRLPPYRPAGIEVPADKVVTISRPPVRTRTGTLESRPAVKPVLVLESLGETPVQKAFAPSALVLLGSGRQSALECAGEGVSRKHALLTCGPDGAWRVFDLQSAGGSWVNGTPVGRAKLYPDDELYLGACGFRVSLEYRSTDRSFDQFKLVAQLHTGARGRVYRGVWTRKGGRAVAVHIFPQQFQFHATGLRRLLRGVPGLAGLRNPHLVRTFRAGAERMGNDRVWFTADEYMAGGSLRDRLRAGGRLPVPAALRMARHAGRGAAALAEAGWVHRNINPGCVLFSADGVVKLGDFFFARPTDAHAAETTAAGELDEPADIVYRAPEYLLGEPASPVGDVYALGASLYEALTGRPPFDPSGSPAEVSRRVLGDPVRPPEELNRAVPRAASQVVCRALAKDPTERFETPAEFVAAITELKAAVAE